MLYNYLPLHLSIHILSLLLHLRLLLQLNLHSYLLLLLRKNHHHQHHYYSNLLSMFVLYLHQFQMFLLFQHMHVFYLLLLFLLSLRLFVFPLFLEMLDNLMNNKFHLLQLFLHLRHRLLYMMNCKHKRLHHLLLQLILNLNLFRYSILNQQLLVLY